MSRADGIIYSVIDTETTGLHFDAAICEIAVIQLDEDLEIIYSYETLVDPHARIPTFITEINRIDNKMIADQRAPGWEKVWPYLMRAIDGTILVGHNIHFDIRMMAQSCIHSLTDGNFNPGRPVDTQELAGGLPMRECLPIYNIDNSDNKHHTAMFDTYAATCILRAEHEKLAALFTARGRRPRPCAAHIPQARRR